MPIQDGKYVSPDWSNSSPPPINASELNALSETVEKADTNYTRDEILSDEVKQLIGLETTDTPNDAFSRITLGNKRYGINLYVKFQNGEPVSGVTITSSGSPPISGSMVTDENGYLFLAQDDTSFTASIDNAGGKVYIDCVENPSVSQTLSDTVTAINFVFENKPDEMFIQNTSITSKISASATSVDICAVGGGGGGQAIDTYGWLSGSGGGGGYAQNSIGVSDIANKQIRIIVGSGGASANPGGDGSNTSVYIGSDSVCVGRGGNGGNFLARSQGNGNGGTVAESTGAEGSNGNDATVYIYNEPSLGLAGGGGGGSGNDSSPQKTGGLPFGSYGGVANVVNAKTPTSTDYGAGGGGGNRQYNDNASASMGGNGCVYLRFHH